jgi:hypothetical protein
MPYRRIAHFVYDLCTPICLALCCCSGTITSLAGGSDVHAVAQQACALSAALADVLLPLDSRMVRWMSQQQYNLARSGPPGSASLLLRPVRTTADMMASASAAAAAAAPRFEINVATAAAPAGAEKEDRAGSASSLAEEFPSAAMQAAMRIRDLISLSIHGMAMVGYADGT